MSSLLPKSDRPAIRMWSPDQECEHEEKQFSGRMTLPQFFRRWFVPVVLKGRGVSRPTYLKYRDSVRWWRRLTRNPALKLIDEFTIARFVRRMRQAKYRRGKLGPWRPMTEFTRAGHLKRLDEILFRAGPTIDGRKPTKNLLSGSQRISVAMPKLQEPKPSFSIEIARKIVKATTWITQRPHHRHLTSCWRSPSRLFAWLCVLFYTGLRTGTVANLRWNMLEQRPEGMFLRIPGAVVSKTHKGLTKFLHQVAWEAIQRLPGPRGDSLIFKPTPAHSHLTDLHEELQQLAGIPKGEWLSPQAWRRTHGTEMAKLGAKAGLKIAQHSLDHADDSTTRSFYVRFEPELIRQLPPIAEALFDPLQKRLF